MLENLISGFDIILRWDTIFAMGIGIAVGIIDGATPGLTSSFALSVGVPLTFGLDPLVGIPFLLAMYKGSTYGGSIPAMLIGTPGTPVAAATVTDGYPLAQQGKAGKALKAALYSSVGADLISDLVLITVAPALALIAMKFGPIQFFPLILFALVVMAGFEGKNIIKGLISVFMGVLLSTIGLDPIRPVSRFVLPLPGLYDLTKGISFVPLLIGMFGFGQALILLEDKFHRSSFFVKDDPDMSKARSTNKDDNRFTLKDFRYSIKAFLSATAIGTFIGALPGIGGSVACFAGYASARRLSKHPEKFGEGAIDGVVGPEAANNAVCGANLIPLLTLGIPGNINAAILAGALMLQGVTPGPLVFKQHGELIFGLFAALIVANFMVICIGNLFIRITSKILIVPKTVLFPMIIMFCVAGTYALDNSLFDVSVMAIAGIVGYFMRKFHFPIAPLIIAFILGELLEKYLRQALIITQGSLLPFFMKPISLFFLILTVIFLIGSRSIRRGSKRKDK